MKGKNYKGIWASLNIVLISLIVGGVLVIFLLSLVGPGVGFLLKSPRSVMAFPDAYLIDNNMRSLALSMSSFCGGSHDCVIVAVYNNLSSQLVYSNTPYNRYVGKYVVWEQKSGDCKSLSGLYVNMMVNMGIISYIDISVKHNHAVALVFPKGKQYYYMVDLSAPDIQRFDIGGSHWDYIINTYGVKQ